MGDHANEQRHEQDDQSQALVSRRSFVVSVAAVGAAATAAKTLPGRLAVSVEPRTEAASAAATTCGSLSLVKAPTSGGELTEASYVSASVSTPVNSESPPNFAGKTSDHCDPFQCIPSG